MHDKELYQKILGISAPWAVTEVKFEPEKRRVSIVVGYNQGQLSCPCCNQPCPGYDQVTRRWRHLDTCQYQTIIEGQVPRVNCPDHQIQQIQVPWAEAGSRLTALFECLVIDWLQEASTKAVAKQLSLSWKQVDGVMQRAVARGKLRREKQQPTRIGIDETSFQKRHEYVTAIVDLDKNTVVDVIDDRKKVPVIKALKKLGKKTLNGIEVVALDMYEPYIQAIRQVIPNASEKMAFDKFHVIAHLTKAVNQVRREEHLQLMQQGNEIMKGTRYLWITGKENLADEQKWKLRTIRAVAKTTSQAWMLKEYARSLWDYESKTPAVYAWTEWCQEALASGLAPMIKIAKMVSNHLQGILTAILLKATNAKCESMNNRIQHIKKIAYGFRNRRRFKNAIMFHLGGLDLYPKYALTHSIG